MNQGQSEIRRRFRRTSYEAFIRHITLSALFHHGQTHHLIANFLTCINVVADLLRMNGAFVVTPQSGCIRGANPPPQDVTTNTPAQL
jgi:hypothetical protein